MPRGTQYAAPCGTQCAAVDGVSRVCTLVSAGILALGGGPDSGFEAGGESTASWGQGVGGGVPALPSSLEKPSRTLPGALDQS